MGSVFSKARGIASLCSNCRNFHVFLSFRGPDVHNTFLAHLHHALVREGVRAYVDREDLRTGDDIMMALRKAISDSRIAIVIFSINFASSSWCLDELVEIMDNGKQGRLVVKPVFYRVEPREVRTPRFSFAKALAAHELKYGKDSDMLRRWRKALSEAGNLSGWHLDADGNEAELIRKIVKDVNVVLDRTHLDVAKYPVGIEPRVAQIKNLLNLESGEVLFVGIWGAVGIGKTTLAKAVFNVVANHFDGCVFLPNVRKQAANQSIGLAKLQEKLLSESLGRNDANVLSIASGISRIKDRLCHKKILLLLDDVNTVEQLEALAGGLDWFGNGSRILITTRDRSLLTARNVHFVHEVEGLPYHQALQLFCKHAFPENHSPNVAQNLVDRCLAYCGALPLALVVLGSLLCNREERHWESMMNLLEHHGPCKEINKILRTSFEELDHNERVIFLAIACFFKGKCRREIEKAMDASGFETSLGISILVERCMITIVKDGAHGSSDERVEMHPLLQRMGRDIVCKESSDELHKHRGTLIYQDIFEVLSNGKGTDTMQALSLRLNHPRGVHFDADTLNDLKDPRLLKTRNVHYAADPHRELPRVRCSGYSAPKTLFSWPRKYKENDPICPTPRVALHDDPWRIPKVGRFGGEFRLRFPRKTPATLATSILIHRVRSIPHYSKYA